MLSENNDAVQATSCFENQREALQLPPLDARIPQWNLSDLIERSCPICNSNNTGRELIRPDKLSVQLCNNCNTY